MDINKDNILYNADLLKINKKSIPDNLFINNSKITNFSDCFSNCTLLEPYPKYIRKQRKEKIEKLREKFGM